MRKRFKNKQLYKYIGSNLLSINPYELVPIYTRGICRAYSGLAIGVKPPHVYAVTDTCYREMLSENVNQSIIIHGESGSGKTEIAKVIIQYLAWVSQEESPQKSSINKNNSIFSNNEMKMDDRDNNEYENTTTGDKIVAKVQF